MYSTLHVKADNGNRTRDLRLTKATLYRLSHISNQHAILYNIFCEIASSFLFYSAFSSASASLLYYM